MDPDYQRFFVQIDLGGVGAMSDTPLSSMHNEFNRKISGEFQWL